jgi:hypothetical protein
MSVQLHIWFPSSNSFFKTSHGALGLLPCLFDFFQLNFALVIISAATTVDYGGIIAA